MRKNRSRIKSWHTVVGAGLLLAATGISYCIPSPLDDWNAPSHAARQPNPVPSTPDSIAAGKTIYAANCLACHGPAGKGDGPLAAACNPPPKDLADPKTTSQTDGALFWKITNGKKPMPSFEATVAEQDRWNVVNYLRTLAPATTEPSDK